MRKPVSSASRFACFLLAFVLSWAFTCSKIERRSLLLHGAFHLQKHADHKIPQMLCCEHPSDLAVVAELCAAVLPTGVDVPQVACTTVVLTPAPYRALASVGVSVAPRMRGPPVRA